MADHDDTWYRLAACRGAPTDLFFPDPGRADHAAVAEAKAVCAACPVQEPCLVAGMAEYHGIWGGLTVRERRAMRCQQRGEAA
jgi:WhiB family transcriptional regulator, redox-sensing transcriptional regulator